MDKVYDSKILKLYGDTVTSLLTDADCPENVRYLKYVTILLCTYFFSSCNPDFNIFYFSIAYGIYAQRKKPTESISKVLEKRPEESRRQITIDSNSYSRSPLLTTTGKNENTNSSKKENVLKGFLGLTNKVSTSNNHVPSPHHSSTPISSTNSIVSNHRNSNGTKSLNVVEDIDKTVTQRIGTALGIKNLSTPSEIKISGNSNSSEIVDKAKSTNTTRLNNQNRHDSKTSNHNNNSNITFTKSETESTVNGMTNTVWSETKTGQSQREIFEKERQAILQGRAKPPSDSNLISLAFFGS